MARNDWGKIMDCGARLINAPDTLGDSLRAPTDEEYRAAGWSKVVVKDAEPSDGQMAKFVKWVENDGTISPVYEYVDLPPEEPRPVRYSKKRFSLALAKRGIFAAFDKWANETEVIEGSGLTVARVLADSWYMSSDDDEFKAVRAVAEAKFGADKIADVLAESEDEEW